MRTSRELGGALRAAEEREQEFEAGETDGEVRRRLADLEDQIRSGASFTFEASGAHGIRVVMNAEDDHAESEHETLLDALEAYSE